MPKGIKGFQKGHTVNKGKKLSHIGVPHTKEAKIKIGIASKNRYFSPRAREKMSEAKRGEKSPNWKGGISLEGYPTDWTETLKEAIRKRDDYVCKVCGMHQEELDGFIKKLDCHHIDYDKDNLDPKNLISLCHSCHIKTNYNREYWIRYFTDY